MAVLGLRFCARAFSSCGKWGPLLITVHGPLTLVASLAAEHRLQMCRLSNCGSWAQPLHGMWDLPGPGLEPVSPALAGGFSTTAPPGKPQYICLLFLIYLFIQSFIYISMDSCVFYTLGYNLNTMLFIYFPTQILPDLVIGSSFRLTSMSLRYSPKPFVS